MTTETYIGLAISAAVATLLPVMVYALYRRRMQLPLRNVFIGASIFVVLVGVLEAMMHVYVLQTNPVSKAYLDASPYAFAVYAAAAAALFEETGRFAAMRWMVKRVPGNGTPLSYNIGHGGIESALVGINVAVIAAIGYMISTGQAASLNLDAATQTQITKMLQGATFSSGLMSGIERTSAFVLQFGFSLLVWQAVRTGNITYWFAAIAAHFAVDFPAALFQKKALPVTIEEFETALVALSLIVLTAVWAFSPRTHNEEPQPVAPILPS